MHIDIWKIKEYASENIVPSLAHRNIGIECIDGKLFNMKIIFWMQKHMSKIDTVCRKYLAS